MSTASRPRMALLPSVVVGLMLANIATLWVARGEFVSSWDLFGATFGVLALNRGGFLDGVRTIAAAVLDQRARPVFTGGESFIYGFIPGLLSNLWPWVLWGELVSFALCTGVSVWLVRRLGGRWWIFAACVLASPSLTSHWIVGFTPLPSNMLAYGLAIGWVLSSRRRGAVLGALLDVVVFAGITAVAFQGYESAKTFFLVPAIAAFTVERVRMPLWRRLVWLGCAAAIAWLAHGLQAGTTHDALASVPRDPVVFARGALAAARAYCLGTYIDFPALAVAAMVALPFLQRDRLFWTVLFVTVCGLVSLNAFQFGGDFLVPHRFLLLALVSALIVTLRLSAGFRNRSQRVAAALVVVGMAYSTWVTLDFTVHMPGDAPRDWVRPKVFPLPYNRSKINLHLWRDRVRDAITLARLGREGPAHHVVLYGFNSEGEDIVNPQLLVARVLLSLGYRTFTERFTFVDHITAMFFEFPLRRPTELGSVLSDLRAPFFLHVHEPDYSPDGLLAKYFNRARVTPVDLGLYGFRSFRVDAFEPPGPTVVPSLATPAEGRPLAEGFCRTGWRQETPAYSPLQHWHAPTAGHIEARLQEALRSGGTSGFYRDLTRARVAAIQEAEPLSTVFHFRGYLDAAAPMRARFTVRAADEVAVVLNGIPVMEVIGSSPVAEYREELLLPAGRSELTVFSHGFGHAGGVTVTSVDDAARPLLWRCDAEVPLSTSLDEVPSMCVP